MLKWSYCWIIHYNISLGVGKNILFFINFFFQCGDGMWWGYTNSSRAGMMFNFSSPLGMSRVTDKYIRIGYMKVKCKTHLHPAPLPYILTPPYCHISSPHKYMPFYLFLTEEKTFIFSRPNIILHNLTLEGHICLFFLLVVLHACIFFFG